MDVAPDPEQIGLDDRSTEGRGNPQSSSPAAQVVASGTFPHGAACAAEGGDAVMADGTGDGGSGDWLKGVPCSECKVVQAVGRLLPLHTGDWQGAMDLVCQPCSDLAPTEFAKKVKAAWRKRRVEKGNERDIARSYSYQQAIKDAEARKEGEGWRDYRKRFVAYICVNAAIIAGAILRAKAWQQREYVGAIQNWLAEKDKSAADPSFIPQIVGTINLLPTEISQFLDEIVPGLSEYYICRRKGCQFFSLNTWWIPDCNRSLWRCPQCGQRYRAWKDQPTFVQCNKVLVACPEEDIKVHGLTMKKGEAVYYLFRWPLVPPRFCHPTGAQGDHQGRTNAGGCTRGPSVAHKRGSTRGAQGETPEGGHTNAGGRTRTLSGLCGRGVSAIGQVVQHVRAGPDRQVQERHGGDHHGHDRHALQGGLVGVRGGSRQPSRQQARLLHGPPAHGGRAVRGERGQPDWR
jgi:hypothetical protein